jgi:paraquat-inducible protein A
MTDEYTAAPTAGLRGCECCGLVVQAPPDGRPLSCPRCHFALHLHKPQSLQRTAALLVTAVVLYIPANLLPVMATASVLGRETHTLVGGILDLWASGSWELSLIVFIASIAVPLLKIAALVLLAWTSHRRSRWRQRERAGLYRLVETVGHWSMLDVFVVVLLVGMVHFGVLATVEVEPGLLAFGAVVVATMLASASFDPKLIWPLPDEAERIGPLRRRGVEWREHHAHREGAAVERA